MSYISVLNCHKQCVTEIPNMKYWEAFKTTKQKPYINKSVCINTPYFNIGNTSHLKVKKDIELIDIPYFKKNNKKSKQKEKKKKYVPTVIPKFLVFILLPFFTKLSNLYKVLLPNSFMNNDFYSCVVCHLVARYWVSNGVLTKYNCYMQYGSWIFKTACCKRCAKLGNKLEYQKEIHG